MDIAILVLFLIFAIAGGYVIGYSHATFKYDKDLDRIKEVNDKVAENVREIMKKIPASSAGTSLK